MTIAFVSIGITSSIEVLVVKLITILKMIDSFNTVILLEFIYLFIKCLFFFFFSYFWGTHRCGLVGNFYFLGHLNQLNT
jgi:hypothetical protein